MNVDGDDGGVSVEVNPSIVMQNGHEDITESFIVSPDTADYDDEASHENTQVPYGKREFGTRKVTTIILFCFRGKKLFLLLQHILSHFPYHPFRNTHFQIMVMQQIAGLVK